MHFRGLNLKLQMFEVIIIVIVSKYVFNFLFFETFDKYDRDVLVQCFALRCNLLSDLSYV